ncbi:MAG: class III extradiol ring-cleavage dioxygenase [Amphiplicatus sp.]
MPLLGDPAYAPLAAMLSGLNERVFDERAIILVTAHWETEQPTLIRSARLDLLYDYYGFPEEAYQIRYPAPGAPELADAVAEALLSHGIEAEFDDDRGFDHGTFVPMALMRPEADVPILQMSVLSSLDPAQHVAVGRALGGVLSDGITLIGSGFSFHNLAALTGRLRQKEVRQGQSLASDFHDWLDDVVCNPRILPEERIEKIVAWAEAPGARFCQPREEHLMPLHVCLGAALARGMSAGRIFGEPVKGYQTSGYHWN